MPVRRLLALAALLGLLAAAMLSLAPAAAEGDPDEFELVLSLAEDSDNIVPAGGELTVNASLRFPWQLPIAPPEGLPSYTPYALNVPGASVAVSNLRISGDLEWDSAGRRRLDLAAHSPIESTRLDLPSDANQASVKAFDGRTLVVRSSRPTNRALYIYDSYTLARAAIISAPAGTGGDHNSGFGASNAWNSSGSGSWYGKAIDVWHETADRAWLFVGSWADSADSRSGMGRLHRFRLDWDDDGVTVTHTGVLHPTAAEADNLLELGPRASYGAAVSFSRDGGTLAVSAPRMNGMGAVYVYSRPDGPGQDWGDLEYADGVKVTVGAVPSFGTSTTTMPFLPGTAYDASNPRSCDAWCSMVWSSVADPYHGTDLGANRVSLSADGRVLVVGAGEKAYAIDTPGGGFTNANRRDNAGEAFVWVAPEGGWQDAPRANVDANGNAKTLIAARTDATNFRRATHYSPGPLRRVTEPAAVLSAAAWPNPGANYFGQETAVSLDGATVAVASYSNWVHIFQRDSADDWASVGGGYLTPDAAFGGLTQPFNTPPHFSLDGSELLIGQPRHSSFAGAVLVYTRPADGTWTNAAANTVRVLQEPGVARTDQPRFGYVTPELTGQRMAIGTQAQHREYLTSPVIRGCTTSTVAGETTASCPLTLPGSTITIPTGTPDGPFTISGSVALQLGSGDPVTLRGSLEVTVGEVDELARIELDFATDPGDADSSTDDRPYPSTIASGESTQLQLAILNERGKAAAAGSITSVLFTAGGGRLSTSFGGGCAAGSGSGSTCSLNVEALNANNADKIPLTITHSGAPGVIGVEATVLGADGELLSTPPVRVVFSGAPAALAVAGASGGGLLGVNAEAAENAEASGTDTDTRDQLTLSVTAADAAGNKVALPRSGRIASLTGPDGARVSSGVAIEWPLGGSDSPTLNAAGDEQLRLDVNRPASAPLANGEYTLEVRAGPLRATHTFSVGGPPSDIALSEPEGELALQSRFSITAAITDAAGAAVPDGTPVNWSATPIGVAATLVETATERTTTGGKASATYLIVATGNTSLRVTAGQAAAATLIEVPDAPAPPVRLLDLLAAPYTQGANTWFGDFAIRASALLSELPNADVVHIWQGNRWFRYSQAEAETAKESVDFTIPPDAVLWFGDDD